MQYLGVDLEQQDDAAGFSGMTLEQDLNTLLIDMNHTGLINIVIESVTLYDGMPKGKFMSSEDKHLVKDENGEPASGILSYSSVVGMLLYLYGHTCPYFDLAFYYCARYMFSPKHSCQLVLDILARHFK